MLVAPQDAAPGTQTVHADRLLVHVGPCGPNPRRGSGRAVVPVSHEVDPRGALRNVRQWQVLRRLEGDLQGKMEIVRFNLLKNLTNNVSLILTVMYQLHLQCGVSHHSRYFVENFCHVPPAIGLILKLLCSPTGNRN